MIIWAVRGQQTMVGDYVVGTTISYSYEENVRIKNVSGEFDDEFELPLAKPCNIALIRIRCVIIRDPPLFEIELVEVPLTYYLQKECTMYIKSVDGTEYEPIKIPITYNFLKFKLINNYTDYMISKQKQTNTTLKPENFILQKQSETITTKHEEINITTLSSNSNNINKILNTNNISKVTTTMYNSSFTVPQRTEQTTFNTALITNETITEFYELNYTESTTKNTEDVTEHKYIIQIKNTDNTKMGKTDILSYIMYVISGTFLIIIMLIIMILHNNYKCINRNRYRYAMQQLMEIPDIEVTEI